MNTAKSKWLLRILPFFYAIFVVFVNVSFELPRGYENNAEQMILARVTADKIFGDESFGGLLVYVNENKRNYLKIEGLPSFTDSFLIINGKPLLQEYSFAEEDVEIYTSQYGVLAKIMSITASTLQTNFWQIALFSKLFAIIFSSFIVFLFLNFFKNRFGSRAMIAMFGIFLLPWFLIFASNFYYLMFTNLVYCLVPFYVFEINRHFSGFPSPTKVMYACYALLTFLYSLAGYNFVTIWIVGALIGIILNRHKFEEGTLNQLFLKVSATIIFAFSSALFLHLNKVRRFSVAEKGESWLSYLIEKKFGVAPNDTSELYRESLSKSPVSVLWEYFTMPIATPWVQSKLPVGLSFLTVGFTILVLCFCVAKRLHNLNEDKASTYLSTAFEILILGLLGAIVWILILRPQSYANSHINAILFFLLMIPCLVGILFSDEKNFQDLFSIYQTERSQTVFRFKLYAIICVIALVFSSATWQLYTQNLTQ